MERRNLDMERATLLTAIRAQLFSGVHLGRPACAALPASELPQLPGLDIDGRPVAFPLLESQAVELLRLKQSGGRKTPAKRRCQSAQSSPGRGLPADHVHVRNAAWDTALAEVVRQLAHKLCVPQFDRVSAQLHEVLVFTAEESMRLSSRPGGFATLLVQLPSLFKGGDVTVRCAGNAQTHCMGGSEFQLPCLAFYSDCKVEFGTITDGQRMMLAYSLSLPSECGPVPVAAPSSSARGRHLAHYISTWINGAAPAVSCTATAEAAPAWLANPGQPPDTGPASPSVTTPTSTALMPTSPSTGRLTRSKARQLSLDGLASGASSDRFGNENASAASNLMSPRALGAEPSPRPPLTRQRSRAKRPRSSGDPERSKAAETSGGGAAGRRRVKRALKPEPNESRVARRSFGVGPVLEARGQQSEGAQYEARREAASGRTGSLAGAAASEAEKESSRWCSTPMVSPGAGDQPQDDQVHGKGTGTCRQAAAADACKPGGRVGEQDGWGPAGGGVSAKPVAQVLSESKLNRGDAMTEPCVYEMGGRGDEAGAAAIEDYHQSKASAKAVWQNDLDKLVDTTADACDRKPLVAVAESAADLAASLDCACSHPVGAYGDGDVELRRPALLDVRRAECIPAVIGFVLEEDYKDGCGGFHRQGYLSLRGQDRARYEMVDRADKMLGGVLQVLLVQARRVVRVHASTGGDGDAVRCEQGTDEGTLSKRCCSCWDLSSHGGCTLVTDGDGDDSECSCDCHSLSEGRVPDGAVDLDALAFVVDQAFCARDGIELEAAGVRGVECMLQECPTTQRRFQQLWQRVSACSGASVMYSGLALLFFPKASASVRASPTAEEVMYHTNSFLRSLHLHEAADETVPSALGRTALDLLLRLARGGCAALVPHADPAQLAALERTVLVVCRWLLEGASWVGDEALCAAVVQRVGVEGGWELLYSEHVQDAVGRLWDKMGDAAQQAVIRLAAMFPNANVCSIVQQMCKAPEELRAIAMQASLDGAIARFHSLPLPAVERLIAQLCSEQLLFCLNSRLAHLTGEELPDELRDLAADGKRSAPCAAAGLPGGNRCQGAAGRWRGGRRRCGGVLRSDVRLSVAAHPSGPIRVSSLDSPAVSAAVQRGSSPSFKGEQVASPAGVPAQLVRALSMAALSWREGSWLRSVEWWLEVVLKDIRKGIDIEQPGTRDSRPRSRPVTPTSPTQLCPEPGSSSAELQGVHARMLSQAQRGSAMPPPAASTAGGVPAQPAPGPCVQPREQAQSSEAERASAHRRLWSICELLPATDVTMAGTTVGARLLAAVKAMRCKQPTCAVVCALMEVRQSAEVERLLVHPVVQELLAARVAEVQQTMQEGVPEPPKACMPHAQGLPTRYPAVNSFFCQGEEAPQAATFNFRNVQEAFDLCAQLTGDTSLTSTLHAGALDRRNQLPSFAACAESGHPEHHPSAVSHVGGSAPGQVRAGGAHAACAAGSNASTQSAVQLPQAQAGIAADALLYGQQGTSCNGPGEHAVCMRAALHLTHGGRHDSGATCGAVCASEGLKGTGAGLPVVADVPGRGCEGGHMRAPGSAPVLLHQAHVGHTQPGLVGQYGTVVAPLNAAAAPCGTPHGCLSPPQPAPFGMLASPGTHSRSVPTDVPAVMACASGMGEHATRGAACSTGVPCGSQTQQAGLQSAQSLHQPITSAGQNWTSAAATGVACQGAAAHSRAGRVHDLILQPNHAANGRLEPPELPGWLARVDCGHARGFCPGALGSLNATGDSGDAGGPCSATLFNALKGPVMFNNAGMAGFSRSLGGSVHDLRLRGRPFSAVGLKDACLRNGGVGGGLPQSERHGVQASGVGLGGGGGLVWSPGTAFQVLGAAQQRTSCCKGVGVQQCPLPGDAQRCVGSQHCGERQGWMAESGIGKRRQQSNRGWICGVGDQNARLCCTVTGVGTGGALGVWQGASSGPYSDSNCLGAAENKGAMPSAEAALHLAVRGAAESGPAVACSHQQDGTQTRACTGGMQVGVQSVQNGGGVERTQQAQAFFATGSRSHTKGTYMPPAELQQGPFPAKVALSQDGRVSVLVAPAELGFSVTVFKHAGHAFARRKERWSALHAELGRLQRAMETANLLAAERIEQER